MGKKLAIRGHSARGKEVIELLEMMGGKNIHNHDGGSNSYSYYVSGNAILHDRLSIAEDDDFEIFCLDEFLDKFPFKVGDFVRIPEYESEVRILKMKWCPLSKYIEYLVYRNDDEEWYTADELLEYNDNPIKTRDCKKCGLHFGSVQCFDKDCPHNTPKTKKENKINQMPLDDDDKLATEVTIMGKKILPPDGYLVGKITKTDNGMIVEYVNKEPKYPKLTNLSECKEILGEKDMYQGVSGYKGELLTVFQRLLIFRDAYWKIAGEKMGLGKPWEPDWNEATAKYTIVVIENKLEKRYALTQNYILAFPTEEMRDAFYENFKDLIEKCKELL